jgi:hypothetical protein
MSIFQMLLKKKLRVLKFEDKLIHIGLKNLIKEKILLVKIIIG